MSELKPCPFCGCEAKPVFRGSCNYVTCSNEDGCLYGMRFHVDTPWKAAHIWNLCAAAHELVESITADEGQLQQVVDEMVKIIIDSDEILAVADECDAADIDTDWAERLRKAVGE